MDWSKDIAPLISRILMGVFYIPSGLKLTQGFDTWVAYYAVRSPVPLTHAHPKIFLMTALLAETGLGLALLLGFQTRLAAALMIAYIAVWQVLFHNFWAMPEAQYAAERIDFFKNGAVIGGLLMIAAHGGGRYSLDAILHWPQLNWPQLHWPQLNWPQLHWPQLHWPHRAPRPRPNTPLTPRQR